MREWLRRLFCAHDWYLVVPTDDQGRRWRAAKHKSSCYDPPSGNRDRACVKCGYVKLTLERELRRLECIDTDARRARKMVRAALAGDTAIGSGELSLTTAAGAGALSEPEPQ